MSVSKHSIAKLREREELGKIRLFQQKIVSENMRFFSIVKELAVSNLKTTNLLETSSKSKSRSINLH